MKIIIPFAAMVVGLAFSTGGAMADKTWSSDPSTYESLGSQQWVPPVAEVPVEAEPIYTPPKSYKLYKAPKAKHKSSPKAID